MIAVTDPFTAAVRPTGLQKGRGGFLRAANDTPYVTDPDGRIVATGPRKGEPLRVAYGSPSGVGRLIENDVGLTKYKQRNGLLGIGMSAQLREACIALVNMEAGSQEFRTCADLILVEADNLTRSWLAADRGSHGHLICERMDRRENIGDLVNAGEALGIDLATQKAVAHAWLDLLLANGLEILAIEASCVDDRWRLAGTLDRIVRCTRELRFAMPTGEVVTIPTGTVLVLDIKFGKDRLAYAIQIASYAQSRPYDVDAETRGEWPWPIDQTHALIAHGDFGGDGRPVAFTLAHVDLVAGREHGGETVARAKAWAAREDIFSVAQLDVEGVASPVVAPGTPSTPPVAGSVATPLGAQRVKKWNRVNFTDESRPFVEKAPTINGPWERDESLEVVPSLGGNLVAGSEELSVAPPNSGPATPVAGEVESAARIPSPAEQREDVYEVGDATRDINTPDPARLAIVDARATLATNPDQGADLSDGFTALWQAMQDEFTALPAEARTWRAALVSEAQRRGVAFHVQAVKTERTYHINKAIIALATAGQCDDEIVRVLLAPIVGDVALFPGVAVGHVIGSLGAGEAERFANVVDAYLAEPDPAA